MNPPVSRIFTAVYICIDYTLRTVMRQVLPVYKYDI